MLDNIKNRFSNLLRRIKLADIGGISEEKKLKEFYDRINDEYFHIRCDILKIKENLNVISCILEACSHKNNNGKYCNDDMKYLIDKTLGNVHEFISCEMLESLIPFNITKGQCLFDLGQYDEALDAWEEVLKVNPCNDYIHSKLYEVVSNCEQED